MKPPRFDFQQPRTIEQTIEFLARPGPDVSLLAGGQSLVRLLNQRLARPDVVVDLNKVPGLDGVEITAACVRIGAMARLCSLERNGVLCDVMPVLSQAVTLVAHPQIRNRATIGGSLCHADPAAELPTVAVALDARLRLRSVHGTRVENSGDFFRSAFRTSRRPEELLTDVEFPRHPGFRFRFKEISRRHGEPALVSVCLGVGLEGGIVTSARLAAGGVADRPIRLSAAERALSGRRLSGNLSEVLDAASAQVEPPSDVHGTGAFRRGMLRTVVRQAVAELTTAEDAR